MDMLSRAALPARRNRRRMLVAMLLGSSLATVGAGAMSLAVFTDSKASTGSWSTGTIVLGVSPAAVFNATGIMPGDSGSNDMTVANTGTAALRWAMTSTSATTPATKTVGGVTVSLDLASQITVLVQSGTCAAPAGTLYSGTLAGAAIGNPAQGAQAGDQSIAAGASQSLCVSWSLPKALADNNYQGVSDATTFTFDAEQTANN